jgi:hypothetical protein
VRRKLEDEKLKVIFECVQGLTFLEWQKLKQAIDDNFRSEATKQNNKIPMAAPEKLMDSYERLF